MYKDDAVTRLVLRGEAKVDRLGDFDRLWLRGIVVKVCAGSLVICFWDARGVMSDSGTNGGETGLPRSVEDAKEVDDSVYLVHHDSLMARGGLAAITRIKIESVQCIGKPTTNSLKKPIEVGLQAEWEVFAFELDISLQARGKGSIGSIRRLLDTAGNKSMTDAKKGRHTRATMATARFTSTLETSYIRKRGGRFVSLWIVYRYISRKEANYTYQLFASPRRLERWCDNFCQKADSLAHNYRYGRGGWRGDRYELGR